MPKIASGIRIPQPYQAVMIPATMAAPLLKTSGEKSITMDTESRLEVSHKTRTLHQEYKAEKNEIEQQRNLKEQEVESEYKQERQKLDQEYTQKRKAMGINLYV